MLKNAKEQTENSPPPMSNNTAEMNLPFYTFRAISTGQILSCGLLAQRPSVFYKMRNSAQLFSNFLIKFWVKDFGKSLKSS
jgi:hypothetical protein